MFRFVRPNNDDIQKIADAMRHEDAVEINASHGYSPIKALTSGLEISDFSAVAKYNDIPLAVFGMSITSHLTGTGVPWLLSSEDALSYKRYFLSESSIVIEEMLNICPKLVNYVHGENKTSIRWLKWLGFTIGELAAFGVKGELFHKFHLERVT